MKPQVAKLVLGKKPRDTRPPKFGAIDRRVHNIRAIWKNQYDDDHGIEKVFRLFLAASQFFFPGLYVKEIFSRRLHPYQDLAVDAYVLLKVFLPVVLLATGNGFAPWIQALIIWSLVETLLYVPTLIFASDVIAKPRSYRRSMLLLFINYLEVIFDFALLYAAGNYLNRPFLHWFDAIYFSFITSATIGYGDFFPTTVAGKFMVSCQSTIFIMFVALFMNFFSNKVQSKGYFGNT